jgi:hypothetical protein
MKLKYLKPEKTRLLYMCECKPWNKMTKDEKLVCANHKIIKGIGVFLFGSIWMYFASISGDVWSALPSTLSVIGLLLILYGLVKRFKV